MERQRINRFDNLKGLLIIMIVFYHTLQLRMFIRNDELILPDYILSVLNCFLTPSFIFMSGLFTSKNWAQDKYVEKNVSNLLLPFLFFQLLHWGMFTRSLPGLLEPRYHLWYLLSLFVWRFMVIPFKKFKFSFLLSIVLALLCGFTGANRLFSLSRTVCYFPFFLAGYSMDKQKLLIFCKGSRQKALAVLVMCIISLLPIVLHYKGLPITEVCYMKNGYDSQGVSSITGLLLRVFAYCIGFVYIACLVILMSDKKSILTTLGKNTMTVYIGHAFIIRAYALLFRRLGYFSEMSEIGFLIFAFVITTAICMVLSERHVVDAYQRFVNLITKIFGNCSVLPSIDQRKSGTIAQ